MRWELSFQCFLFTSAHFHVQQDVQLLWLAQQSAVQDAQGGSSAETSSDTLLVFCSEVNTSDCSGTSAHSLHSGHYNTSPLQDFLQEISNLQLESHMPASEIVLQLRQWAAKRQFCTSNTAGEGDRLVLGRGDRVTPQRPVCHWSTVTANATTQEGTSLTTRQYYPEYYYFNTPVRLHRTKHTDGSSTYQSVQAHDKTWSLPVLLNYVTIYYFQVGTRPGLL